MTDRKDYKLFISADIEGITGVVSWDETETGKPDYPYFRKLMAQEINAAIEAALECGVTEVVVRDAHGDARNIMPNDLHAEAKLIRNWSEGPMCMMEGLDEMFDAVLFIGYHAKAGTPNAPLKHTYSGRIFDLKVNGLSLPEAGWNALIAGHFNVPLIFASGDRALCEQVRELMRDVVTVPVKQGIGRACLSLHPDKAHQAIREGVTRAFAQRALWKPYRLEPPFRLEVTFSDEGLAWRAQWYPGVKLINERTMLFENSDFFEIMRCFSFII
ncbi:M55 family metallopeptidase [bacterium]|nr:M55 family metallopeptidase [bacterium]